MTKRMLIDAAHKEEVRVVVINDDRIEDFEVETADKEQIKGNIYVAEVTRVEPSLQAAFVSYGGNRNGFLAFSEIHPAYFDLPQEEKEALLKELDDIAASRKGRDTEAEAQLEEEARLKEEAKLAPKELAPKEVKPDEKNGNKEDTTTPKEEMPTSLDGLTSEEMEEDARALAMASTIIIDDQAAPVEEAPKKRRGRPSKKPKRHSPEADDKSSNKDEATTKPVEAKNTEKSEDEKKEDKKEQPQRRQPIHRRYNIKDVLKEGSKILIQINKEERGNKGAAVSTYISLPGRYSVLMPNTPYAGGISRKITDFSVRRKIKSIVNGLKIPNNMGVIIRTAGVGQEPENIEKDVNNMLTLWEKIEKSFKNNKKAPELVHEDGSLSIRAIRDMFKADVDEVHISGYKTYRATKNYIKNLMPEFASKVKEHKLQTPVFAHYDVEEKLNRLHTTRVNLPSGGYLIINPTEALVSVDVNSGKATQEKNIEETALKTNLEAAEEMSRQLRLRDLAGLIVIDFIDMEENKNEKAVERMMRKSVRKDRARIQIASISTFGLLEMSRQRLRPSLGESTTQSCSHCNGTGVVASLSSAALTLLRSLEDENVRTKAERIIITTSDDLALYILNDKRELIKDIETRYKFTVYIRGDSQYHAPDHRIEVIRKDHRGHEKSQITEVILREPSDDGEYVKPSRRRTRKNKNESHNPRPKHQHDKHNKDSKDNKSSDDKANTTEEISHKTENDDKSERKGRRGGGRVRHLRRGSRRDDKGDKNETSHKDGDKTIQENNKVASSHDNSVVALDDKKPTGDNRSRHTSHTDKKESKPLAKNIKEKKPAPAKGITVETVSATGKSSVTNTKDKSVSGKFQRWWNKR